MTSDDPREVVDAFLAAMSASLSGEQVDFFSMLDDNVDYVRHGVVGSAAKCRGVEEAREKLFPPEVMPNIAFRPGSGIYPVEYIQEGNRLAVVCKGRGTMARGIPYNNTYLFFFEVHEGTIVRVVEDLDSSLSRRCLWDMHLEEGDFPLKGEE